MILDALIDAIVDTARLLPFLFVTYLLMAYLEHFSEEKTEKWLSEDLLKVLDQFMDLRETLEWRPE